MNKQVLSDFFDFIVKRQLIYYKKSVLNEPFPWTTDKILQKYKFCNVFRGEDKTTIKFINECKKINSKNKVDLLLNCTLQRILNQSTYYNYMKLQEWNNFDIEKYLKDFEKYQQEINPVYSSAYRIAFSIDTIIRTFGNFNLIANKLYNANKPWKLINYCVEINHIGPFLSYQILLDLSALNFWEDRYTDNDFVIVGPGAKPVLQMITKDPSHQTCYDCLEILNEELQQNYLPKSMERICPELKWEDITYKNSSNYPYLSLSDLEHATCEYRKYLGYLNNTKTKKIRLYKPQN